jgi:hypothetical protein
MYTYISFIKINVVALYEGILRCFIKEERGGGGEEEIMCIRLSFFCAGRVVIVRRFSPPRILTMKS